MTTKTIQNIRERLDSLKVNYEGVYRFPEAELKIKNGSTIVTVTCAIHGNFDLSLVDAHDTCLCKKCESFFDNLVSTSDKQKAFETMREIYSFAFDNRRLVDRFRKVTKNRNNMNTFYNMFKEAKKAKEEAEPIVVHQTTTSTVGDVNSIRSFRSVDQVLADLNEVFDNTLVFPKLRSEYSTVTSALTVICPIHGKTKASFSKMFWSKSACLKCRTLRRKLVTAYGKEHVFEKLLEQYRKAKDNPDYVEPSLDQLLIDANKTSITTMDDFDRVASDIVNQHDKDDSTVSEMFSVMSKLVDDSAASEMFSQQPTLNTDWQQNIVPAPNVVEQPKEISPVKQRAVDIISFFNNLNLNDIVKLHTDIDLETDEETCVLSLKSGQTIKVC